MEKKNEKNKSLDTCGATIRFIKLKLTLDTRGGTVFGVIAPLLLISREEALNASTFFSPFARLFFQLDFVHYFVYHITN